MDLATLESAAAKLARPVLLLVTERVERGAKPLAIWHGSEGEVDDEGRVHWITCALAQHPDTSSRRHGVLEVWADGAHGSGVARVSPTMLPRAEPGELRLYGRPASDLPSLEQLARRGPTEVQGWIAEHRQHDLVRDYEQRWLSAHPLRGRNLGVVAQLGGWPLSWPETEASELDARVVLRTYRDAEPYVEVLELRGRTLTYARTT